MKKALMLLLIACSLAWGGQSRGIFVDRPRCEYAENPLGVDSTVPRFSWILESPERGQSQTAYRILVASNPTALRADTGDKWDSGKVNSERSVNVPYGGTRLSSGETCWYPLTVTTRFRWGALKVTDSSPSCR